MEHGVVAICFLIGLVANPGGGSVSVMLSFRNGLVEDWIFRMLVEAMVVPRSGKSQMAQRTIWLVFLWGEVSQLTNTTSLVVVGAMMAGMMRAVRTRTGMAGVMRTMGARLVHTGMAGMTGLVHAGMTGMMRAGMVAGMTGMAGMTGLVHAGMRMMARMMRAMGAGALGERNRGADESQHEELVHMCISMGFIVWVQDSTG